MSIHLFSSSHSIDIGSKKTGSTTQPFTYEPKFVYIPITSSKNELLVELLNVGSFVKKGSVIGRQKEDSFPYYSPISGVIKEVVEMPLSDFTCRKCYKIENDYLSNWETCPKLTVADNYSKTEIYNYLKNSGIIERCDYFLPVYKKFEPEYKLETLIINATEFNPYSNFEEAYTSTLIEYIYFAIPFIKKLSGVKNIYICVTSSQKELIKKIETSKKEYNNLNFELKIVDDMYPVNDRNLSRLFSKAHYNLVSQEIGIVTLSLFVLEMIGRFFFEGKRADLAYYYIDGEVNNACCVISPFGVLASNLVDIVGQDTKLNKEDLLFIESNPIGGLVHANLNYLMLFNSSGIFANKKIDLKENRCIKCGKCINYCPSDLHPHEIFFNDRNNNYEKLKKLNVNKCVGCGICSYICPSNIDLSSICYKAKINLRNKDENK